MFKKLKKVEEDEDSKKEFRQLSCEDLEVGNLIREGLRRVLISINRLFMIFFFLCSLRGTSPHVKIGINVVQLTNE